MNNVNAASIHQEAGDGAGSGHLRGKGPQPFPQRKPCGYHPPSSKDSPSEEVTLHRGHAKAVDAGLFGFLQSEGMCPVNTSRAVVMAGHWMYSDSSRPVVVKYQSPISL